MVLHCLGWFEQAIACLKGTFNTLSKSVGLSPSEVKRVCDLRCLFCVVCAERLRT